MSMTKPDPTAKFTLAGSYNRQDFIRILAAMGLTSLVLGLASNFYFASNVGFVWTVISLFILLTPAGLITVLLLPTVRRHELPVFAAFTPALILYVLGIQQALTHLVPETSTPTQTSLSTFVSAVTMIGLIYSFFVGLPLLRRNITKGRMAQTPLLNAFVQKTPDPDTSLRREIIRVLAATGIAITIMDAVPFLLIGEAVNFAILIDDFLMALPFAIGAAFFIFFVRHAGFRLPVTLVYLLALIYSLSYAIGVYQATRPFAVHGGAEHINSDYRTVMIVSALALAAYLLLRLGEKIMQSLRRSQHIAQPPAQQTKNNDLFDRQTLHLLVGAGVLGLILWQPLPDVYVDSTLEPDAILSPPSLTHYQGLMENLVTNTPDCSAPTFLTTDGRKDKPVPGLSVKVVRAYSEPIIYLINLKDHLSGSDRTAILDHMTTVNQRVRQICNAGITY